MSSLNLCFTLPLCLIFLFVDTSFYTNSRIMMSFLDNFAQRLVSINLIQRHKTSFQDYFEHWVVLLLTIFARRLVTLRLTQRHKMSFSWQICSMSRPLVDNFARRLVSISLIQRHKTPFQDNLRIELTSCWHFCTTTRYFTSNSSPQDALSWQLCTLTHPFCI